MTDTQTHMNTQTQLNFIIDFSKYLKFQMQIFHNKYSFHKRFYSDHFDII